MFVKDEAACWGYGNYPVEPDMVCDSWAQGQDAEQGENY